MVDLQFSDRIRALTVRQNDPPDQEPTPAADAGIAAAAISPVMAQYHAIKAEHGL